MTLWGRTTTPGNRHPGLAPHFVPGGTRAVYVFSYWPAECFSDLCPSGAVWKLTRGAERIRKCLNKRTDRSPIIADDIRGQLLAFGTGKREKLVPHLHPDLPPEFSPNPLSSKKFEEIVWL